MSVHCVRFLPLPSVCFQPQQNLQIIFGPHARDDAGALRLRLPRAASRSAPGFPAETARDVRGARARSEGCVEAAAACCGSEAGGDDCRAGEGMDCFVLIPVPADISKYLCRKFSLVQLGM